MIRISRKLKLLLAVVLNIFLIAALFTVVTKFADSLLLTILTVSFTHLSVCGSLLYFLYISPADTAKNGIKDNRTANYFFAHVPK